MWREAVWAELQNCPTWPNVPPALLRELRVYSGQAGVWFDQSSTRQICPSGIAVSVLNTGQHYDDDVDDVDNLIVVVVTMTMQWVQARWAE